MGLPSLDSLNSIVPKMPLTPCDNSVPAVSADTVKGLISGALDKAKTQATTLGGVQTAGLESKFKDMQSQVSGLTGGAKASAMSAINGLKSQANDLKTSALNSLPKVDTSAVTDVMAKAKSSVSAVTSSINGIKDSMSSALSGVQSQLSGLTSATSAITAKFGASGASGLDSISSGISASMTANIESAVSLIKSPPKPSSPSCPFSDPAKALNLPKTVPSPVPAISSSANVSPKVASAISNATLANTSTVTPNPAIAGLKQTLETLIQQLTTKDAIIATNNGISGRLNAYISVPANLNSMTQADIDTIYSGTVPFSPSSVHLSTTSFPEATLKSVATLNTEVSTAQDEKTTITQSIEDLKSQIQKLESADGNKTNDKASESNKAMSNPLPEPTKPTLSTPATVDATTAYTEFKTLYKSFTTVSKVKSYSYTSGISPSGVQYGVYLYNEFPKNSSKASWEKYIKYIKSALEICSASLKVLGSPTNESGLYVVASTPYLAKMYFYSNTDIQTTVIDVTAFQTALNSLMSAIQTSIIPQFALTQTNNPTLVDPKPTIAKNKIPDEVKKQASALKQVFTDAKTYITSNIVPAITEFKNACNTVNSIQAPYSTSSSWKSETPAFAPYVASRKKFTMTLLEDYHQKFITSVNNDIQGGTLSSGKYDALGKYLDVTGFNAITSRLWNTGDIRSTYVNKIYNPIISYLTSIPSDATMEQTFVTYQYLAKSIQPFINYLDLTQTDLLHAGAWVNSLDGLERSISDLQEIENG